MLQRIHRFFDVPLTLLRLLYLRVDFDLKDLNAGQSIEEDVFKAYLEGIRQTPQVQVCFRDHS